MQDNLTQGGASALAKAIRAYWAEKGYPNVHTWVEHCAGAKQGGGPHYAVRSDLLNSWPRRDMREAA